MRKLPRRTIVRVLGSFATLTFATKIQSLVELAGLGPVRYTIRARFAEGFTREDFYNQRHQWENCEGFCEVNAEFIRQNRLFSCVENVSEKRASWRLKFASHEDLVAWRKEILNRGYFISDQIPAEVRYRFFIS